MAGWIGRSPFRNTHICDDKHDREHRQLDEERHHDAVVDAEVLLEAYFHHQAANVNQLEREGEVVDKVVLERGASAKGRGRRCEIHIPKSRIKPEFLRKTVNRPGDRRNTK